jgi:segregation and condensation protein A
MPELPAEFRATLESYKGPLDLLLYLIKRDEIDVFDIPIARIIEQYQVFLDVLKDVDPNACGEFLVMAANLMEIKSKLLLPREELTDDEEMEDPRIELVRQLLEYKKYKERAMLLEKRIDERRRRYERPVLSPGADLDDGAVEGAIPLGNISVWDLLTAFHKIQIALGARVPHRVMMGDRPIAEYIAALEDFLTRTPTRTALFEELFSEARSRIEAIGFFLAILELAKERRLSFRQEEIFGPIEVRLHEEDEVRRLLAASGREEIASADPAATFLLRGEGLEASAEPILESSGETELPTESSGEADDADEADPEDDGDRQPVPGAGPAPPER